MNQNNLLNIPFSKKDNVTLVSQNATPFMTFSSINPLVAAATPLLLLLTKLRNTPSHNNVLDLRNHVLNEIRAFEIQAHGLQCSPHQILAARYCLCTALDEVVLLTSWGSNSIWTQQTLLSIIQKETWGGERFFIILETLSEEAKKNLPLLELLYFILCLGFEGKYYNEEKMVRDEIRQRLFNIIKTQREEPEKILSPSLNILRNTVRDKKPLFPKWKIFSLAAATLFLIGIAFNTATYFSARKTLQGLKSIHAPDPILIATEVVAKPVAISSVSTIPPKPKITHHSKHHFLTHHKHHPAHHSTPREMMNANFWHDYF